MKRMLRALAGAAVAAAALLGAAMPASADTQDFSFESLDVEYSLTRAADGVGEVRVVETFVAVFPEIDQNRGMQRSIPESYDGAPLDPQLVSVTDGAGTPRPIETESDDGFLIVTSRGDDYVHGAQTYVFTYTLRNVTRYFANTGADEFYWDVNGVDWAQPFGRVTARVIVEPSLVGARTGEQACYAGPQDATTPCDELRAEGDDTIVAEARDLGPHETLTVAAGFRQGTFVSFDPSYLASPWGWWQGAGVLAMVGAFVSAGMLRARRLRDAPGRPTIIAEYTPPRTVDALESAVLLGKTTTAIPAEVLEQAVVGSIRIVEGDKRLFGGVKLRAELIDPSLADGDGRMLLDGLFGAGATAGAEFEFGTQDTRFSSAARAILAAAGTELARRGLRREVPLTARILPFLLALVATVAIFVFGILALNAMVTPWLPLGLLIASVPCLFVVGALIAHKPLTAVGADTRDHLAGLKQFIEWAEADRIRMLQSPAGAERVAVDTDDPRQMLRIYESLLPYAVVFGQEKQWAAKLAVLYDTTGSPGWYSGTSGFNAAAFSAGIGSLSSSSSSSSGTGGSSGGGSAGGGGGGGGGGGV